MCGPGTLKGSSEYWSKLLTPQDMTTQDSSNLFTLSLAICEMSAYLLFIMSVPFILLPRYFYRGSFCLKSCSVISASWNTRLTLPNKKLFRILSKVKMKTLRYWICPDNDVIRAAFSIMQSVAKTRNSMETFYPLSVGSMRLKKEDSKPFKSCLYIDNGISIYALKLLLREKRIIERNFVET